LALAVIIRGGGKDNNWSELTSKKLNVLLYINFPISKICWFKSKVVRIICFCKGCICWLRSCSSGILTFQCKQLKNCLVGKLDITQWHKNLNFWFGCQLQHINLPYLVVASLCSWHSQYWFNQGINTWYSKPIHLVHIHVSATHYYERIWD